MIENEKQIFYAESSLIRPFLRMQTSANNLSSQYGMKVNDRTIIKFKYISRKLYDKVFQLVDYLIPICGRKKTRTT